MKRWGFYALVGMLIFVLVPSAQARHLKADAYFGYSHVGANLYGPKSLFTIF
jgi:hypothetical protein